MIRAIIKLLGFGPGVDYANLMNQGALILDVRSKGEYDQGHIQGSLNISVDKLSGNLSQLKEKERIIITCCASGLRSAAAKKILRANGYSEVYNGGSWTGLRRKIE